MLKARRKVALALCSQYVKKSATMTPDGTKQIKYPLIVAASRALGVSRPTLFRALEGAFANPQLVAGYRQFVAGRIAATAPPPPATPPPAAAKSGPPTL